MCSACTLKMADERENGVQSTKMQTDEELMEKEHFHRILNAFRHYRNHFFRRVSVSENSYNNLSEEHKKLIPKFLDNLQTIRTCVEHNYEIIRLIIKDAEFMFENQKHDIETEENQIKILPATRFDMEKLNTTLKQFARDWSESGHQERSQCYEPVIKEIRRRFPPQLCDPNSVSVLVPGAGLGRLAYELARFGYQCQGNEWSLFMLLASNFVLNKCKSVESFTLYPWIHQWCNHKNTDDQTQPIKFPDVNPSDLPENANFSMAAGDFLEIYTEPDNWDCVATVFFIDTAHNVIAYIETIWKILKPGGYWVNLGPLLYHFSDMPDEESIELSYEEVRKVIEQVGFQFEKEETNVNTTYTQNPRSMLSYEYHSVFFVVRKPA